jgi:hypothetical protein
MSESSESARVQKTAILRSCSIVYCVLSIARAIVRLALAGMPPANPGET